MKERAASINMRLECISFFIFCLISLSSHGQQQVRIHADGISISQDKTPKEALKEALIDAKKNALLKAGIPENLVVSNLLYEYGNERNVESYFHGISNIESNANILIDSIYTERKQFDQYGNMVISVEIDAVVFKYSKSKDSSFFFKISELKDLYYENESIHFSFEPSQDGYLTIFAFNENESYVLYPFEHDQYDYLSDVKAQLFTEDRIVSFPINEAYKPGYSIEMNAPSADERSLLIFVFTKKYRPWIDDQISLESVMRWMYKIPLNQREVAFRNVVLKQIE